MKLTSIMRLNSAASDFPNGADSAIPALATRISIGWGAAGFRNRSTNRGLIRDIGHACKMCGTRSNRLLQGRAIAAEHRDGRASACQRGRDLAANASPAAGDDHMRRTRQSGHARISPNELKRETCIYFRLQAFARNQLAVRTTKPGLLDRSSAAGSVALTRRRDEYDGIA